MAKSRTRGRPMTRRRKRRADWVYLAVQREGIDRFGSYGEGSQGLHVVRNDPVLGTNNGQAMVLMDSVAFQTTSVNQTPGALAFVPAAARPEGRGRKVLMVEGDVMYSLNGWTTGMSYGFAYRLGWFEQDTLTGLPSLQAEYSIFDTASIVGSQGDWDVVNFANEKLSNRREKFFWVNYTGDGRALNVERFRVPIKMRPPSSKHALMLYWEVSGSMSSVTASVNFYPRLRSLVEV